MWRTFLMVNNPPAMQEMQVQSLGQKDPYIRKWQSIFARKIQGMQNLMGYLPCGHKESDTTCNKTTTVWKRKRDSKDKDVQKVKNPTGKD